MYNSRQHPWLNQFLIASLPILSTLNHVVSHLDVTFIYTIKTSHVSRRRFWLVWHIFSLNLTNYPPLVIVGMCKLPDFCDYDLFLDKLDCLMNNLAPARQG
ncbi:hypothetical protein F4803DRAFT_512344 [Xylaria telfairii]|nr:hypothetical protein F4803DRAFT_512344 [Xylaria telfairii]